MIGSRGYLHTRNARRKRLLNSSIQILNSRFAQGNAGTVPFPRRFPERVELFDRVPANSEIEAPILNPPHPVAGRQNMGGRGGPFAVIVKYTPKGSKATVLPAS